MALLIEAGDKLRAAARPIREVSQSIVELLKADGARIGDEVKRFYDAGDFDNDTGSVPTRSEYEMLADEKFRAVLTQNRGFWAAHLSHASGIIASAFMVLHELATQYHVEAEALATRIRGTHNPLSNKPGDPVHSAEHQVLANLAYTLETILGRLADPAEMSLLPDLFEVEYNTVWELWAELGFLCTEYEVHVADLTDLARTLQVIALVQYDRRSWTDGEE